MNKMGKLKANLGYLAMIVSLNFSLSVSAGVYQWVDEHGQTHFGDRAPVGGKSKNISAALCPLPKMVIFFCSCKRSL